MELLGLPLETALLRCEQEGIPVTLIEVTCRKPLAGNDARVIKAEQTENGITLYWSSFLTAID